MSEPVGQIKIDISIIGERARLDHNHQLANMTAKQVGFTIGLLMQYALELRDNNARVLSQGERDRFDAGYQEAMAGADECDVNEGFILYELPPKGPQ